MDKELNNTDFLILKREYGELFSLEMLPDEEKINSSEVKSNYDLHGGLNLVIMMYMGD